MLVATDAGFRAAVSFAVEAARSYRDRLVLKLRGVDDATAASALKGRWVFAPAEEVPQLPRDVHYQSRLVGLQVLEESGRPVGRIVDVVGTGGVDLLVVEGEDAEEILIPLAREIVLSVNESEGVAKVRLPEGLLALNRRERSSR